MFLVTFLIIILVLSSSLISNNSSLDRNNPVFNKTVILNNKNKAYSILLHSIRKYGKNVSGYSDKYDSIKVFPMSDQIFTILTNKSNNYPYKNSKCIFCHLEE